MAVRLLVSAAVKFIILRWNEAAKRERIEASSVMLSSISKRDQQVLIQPLGSPFHLKPPGDDIKPIFIVMPPHTHTPSTRSSSSSRLHDWDYGRPREEDEKARWDEVVRSVCRHKIEFIRLIQIFLLHAVFCGDAAAPPLASPMATYWPLFELCHFMPFFHNLKQFPGCLTTTFVTCFG